MIKILGSRSELEKVEILKLVYIGACTSSQYKCPFVDMCISKHEMCDGKYDCPERDDEYGDEGWSCCTISNPCGEGKGDCDNDSHCKANLKCGNDNCNTTLGFHPEMDCCYEPGNLVIISFNKTTIACKINQLIPGIIWISKHIGMGKVLTLKRGW